MGMNNGRISIGLSGGNAVDEVVVVADDAARLALPVSEGLFVLQLDRDELWEYDLTTASWVRIAGIEAANPYTIAGYNGVGENRPIPGLFYIDQPTQYRGVHVNPTLLATITDYEAIEDTTLIDGLTLATYKGVRFQGTVGATLATPVADVRMFSTVVNFDANADVTDYVAYEDAPSFQVGSDLTNSYNAYWLHPQILAANASSFNGFINQANIDGSIDFVSSFCDFQQIMANAVLQNLMSVQSSPTVINGSTVDSIFGFHYQPTVDTTTLNSFRSLTLNGDIGMNFATSINSVTQVELGTNWGANVTLPNGYTGFGIHPTFDQGITIGGALQLIVQNPSVDVAALPLFAHHFMGALIGVNAATAITFMSGLTIADTIGVNATIDNYQGISVAPFTTLGGQITTNFTGLNINLNNATPVGGQAYGIQVDLTNATTTNKKIVLNTNGGAIQAQSPVDTSVFTPVPYDNSHSISGSFTVASGSPLLATPWFMNYLGHQVIIDDNVTADLALGAASLGISVNGFANQVAVTAGNTLDTMNYMMAGGSFPALSTGGTITNLSMFRALGLINGGGTLTITNEILFHGDAVSDAGAPTNFWGVKIDATTAENFLQKSLAINTVTQKVSAAGVGLEIYQKDFVLDEGEFWLYDPSASGFKSVVKAPTLTADTLFALPPSNGVAGEVLTTDGAGNTSWSNVPVPNVQNTPAAPQSLNNNDTIAIDDTRQKNIVFVSGNAAAITVDATTGVQDGTFNGQECVLVGMDDTNTVTVDSVGNVEINGSVTLGYHDSITLMWDNTNAVWFEISRS